MPQVIIGDEGSLQNILGPVFVSADSHQNSPLVTTIDGRNDPSRPNVSFTQPTYTEPPSSIVSLAYDTGLSRFYQQVDGLAPRRSTSAISSSAHTRWRSTAAQGARTPWGARRIQCRCRRR